MVEQIDKYGDKLFADPITVKTRNGPLQIAPQRTNNIMERFFRNFRRGARRKCGHNSISRFLQSMIADTPLVRNLENPNYLKILLNGRSTLAERFAQIQVGAVRKELHDALNSLEKFAPPKSVNSSTRHPSRKPFAACSQKPRNTQIQRSFVIIEKYRQNVS